MKTILPMVMTALVAAATAAEVDALIGDATKAAESLGWKASIHTDELARIMVDADIAALECEGKPWIDKPVLAGWR